MCILSRIQRFKLLSVQFLPNLTASKVLSLTLPISFNISDMLGLAGVWYSGLDDLPILG